METSGQLEMAIIHQTALVNVSSNKASYVATQMYTCTNKAFSHMHISLSTLVLNSRDRHENMASSKNASREQPALTTTFSFNILPYNLLLRCY